jgi:hypothetical protein
MSVWWKLSSTLLSLAGFLCSVLLVLPALGQHDKEKTKPTRQGKAYERPTDPALTLSLRYAF